MAMDWENVDPSGQTVVFWHQHTRDRETALNEIVADFNATNEYGITVEAEYQGGYGDIFNKMLAVMNTEEAPNLVVAYQNQAATYQLGDSLVDMNGMVNSAMWGLTAEEQADFFPGFFKADVFPSFGGQRLGLAPNRSMEMVYYNMDWLTELGYDAPPTTPAEFKEMACAATAQPFSKSVGDTSIGYQLSIDASRFASWTFAFGGDVFDYDAGQFSYNSPAAVEAMTFLQDLFAEGCATLVAEAYGDQTDFGNGALLFTVGSSSGLPFYQSVVDEGAQFELGRRRHSPHHRRARHEHLRRQRQHPQDHPGGRTGRLGVRQVLHQPGCPGQVGSGQPVLPRASERCQQRSPDGRA